MTDSEKLDLLLVKITQMDGKFDNLDKEVKGLGEKVDSLDAKVGSLDARVSGLEEEFKGLHIKADKLDEDVTEIRLTLENEISVNIRRVAEGHLDLSRNLYEMRAFDSEKEMLVLKVKMLDTEVRRIKAKLGIVAW